MARSILIILLFCSLTLSKSYAQQSFQDLLVNAAIELINDKVLYVPKYYSLDYPMGDLPEGKGVKINHLV